MAFALSTADLDHCASLADGKKRFETDIVVSPSSEMISILKMGHTGNQFTRSKEGEGRV